MKITRILTRSSLALALLALAACQTPPTQQGTATAPAPSTSAATPVPETAAESSMQPAAAQGVPVAVFLADMVSQEGWISIPIGGNATVYLDPQPIVTREDLTGIQAGANQEGQGLLALMLSDHARARLEDLTTRNPNKRLALVVGRTLMAAPGYDEPVSTGQLIFPVGTEDNATAAARAIAGVDPNAPAQPAVPASGTGLNPQQ